MLFWPNLIVQMSVYFFMFTECIRKTQNQCPGDHERVPRHVRWWRYVKDAKIFAPRFQPLSTKIHIINICKLLLWLDFNNNKKSKINTLHDLHIHVTVCYVILFSLTCACFTVCVSKSHSTGKCARNSQWGVFFRCWWRYLSPVCLHRSIVCLFAFNISRTHPPRWRANHQAFSRCTTIQLCRSFSFRARTLHVYSLHVYRMMWLCILVIIQFKALWMRQIYCWCKIILIPGANEQICYFCDLFSFYLL